MFSLLFQRALLGKAMKVPNCPLFSNLSRDAEHIWGALSKSIPIWKYSEFYDPAHTSFLIRKVVQRGYLFSWLSLYYLNDKTYRVQTFHILYSVNFFTMILACCTGTSFSSKSKGKQKGGLSTWCSQPLTHASISNIQSNINIFMFFRYISFCNFIKLHRWWGLHRYWNSSM